MLVLLSEVFDLFHDGGELLLEGEGGMSEDEGKMREERGRMTGDDGKRGGRGKMREKGERGGGGFSYF